TLPPPPTSTLFPYTTLFRSFIEQRLRQTSRLRPKNQKIVFSVASRGIRSGCFLREIEQLLAVDLPMKLCPRFMHAKVDEFPVVETRALQVFVVNFKTQRLDQ